MSWRESPCRIQPVLFGNAGSLSFVKDYELRIGLSWMHEVEVDVQVTLLHPCAKLKSTKQANVFCYTRKEEKSAVQAAGILRCESLEIKKLPHRATMKSRWCGTTIAQYHSERLTGIPQIHSSK